MKIIYNTISRSLVFLIMGMATGAVTNSPYVTTAAKIAAVITFIVVFIFLSVFVYQSWDYLKWRYPYDIAKELDTRPSGVYLATGIQLDFKTITVDLTKPDSVEKAWIMRWEIYKYLYRLDSGHYVSVKLFNDRITGRWYCMTKTY